MSVVPTRMKRSIAIALLSGVVAGIIGTIVVCQFTKPKEYRYPWAEKAEADWSEYFWRQSKPIPIPRNLDLETNTIRQLVFWLAFARQYESFQDKSLPVSTVATGFDKNNRRWVEWWDATKGLDMARWMLHQRDRGMPFSNQIQYVDEHYGEYFITPTNFPFKDVKEGHNEAPDTARKLVRSPGSHLESRIWIFGTRAGAE